jgi:S-DNA-T family DNA segregation ATPase FtsK/SpoIIIE
LSGPPLRPPRPGNASAPPASLADRLAGRLDELLALVASALALLVLLGMAGLTHGAIIDALTAELRRWLGWGAWSVPLMLGLAAVALWQRGLERPPEIAWRRVIVVEILLIGVLGLLAVSDGLSLARAEAGSGGGLIGWGLARLTTDLLGQVLGVVALAGGLMLAAVYLAREARRHAARRRKVDLGEMLPMEAAAPASAAQPAATMAARPTRLPSEFRKSFKVEAVPPEKPAKAVRRDKALPPLSVLAMDEPPRVTTKEVNQTAGLIEKTLADFGLPARVVDFRAGPAVTQFAVEPGFTEHVTPEGEARRQKVRVSQISALADDLALALSAPTVRIEAPVPGQSYVGIEVPNRRSAMVRLGPLLRSDAFQGVPSALAIALGRDVAGQAIVADLAAMPHLLIAGTTGSGKSVCITALTACLAMNNAPEELQLVMIDPKMVELVRFNGLPHLLGKVETDLERITGVLRWCTIEMDRRYKLLEEAKAREIESYNQKMRRRKDGETLPRIVVLVDELADLMMMAPDQTERTLVRLAQMARAVGIHLVVATQRPSTDIVTGLIKANFPARISFAVASGVDSRVILDAQGAESLLGKGDMLFLSPEASAPARLQGAFVSDHEIERLVDFWRGGREAEPAPAVHAPWDDMLTRAPAEEEADDVLERAIEIVRQTGQASASMLQRRLRIGYPRAARLMDQLEEMGLVGRVQAGGRTREVLLGEPDEEDHD